MALFIPGQDIDAVVVNPKVLYIGSAAPGTMTAGQLWFDTDDNKLKERNAANSAWIERPGVTLAATITGLWTFDRGASAPFAVAAGGAKVANLDVDKLDGKDSGVDDDEVLVLPAATEGQILIRGASNWEVGDMKKLEIIEFHSYQRNEQTGTNVMRRGYGNIQDYDSVYTDHKQATPPGYESGYYTVPEDGTIVRVTAGSDVDCGAGSINVSWKKNDVEVRGLTVTAWAQSNAENIAVTAGDRLSVSHTKGAVAPPTGSLVAYFVIEYD